MNTDRNDWLANLKVGDKVVVVAPPRGMTPGEAYHALAYRIESEHRLEELLSQLPPIKDGV